MLTEKDYCHYDTCVALKELGCSLSSFEKWENKEGKLELVPHYPLYAAQKWLREEKEVYVTVIPEYNDFSPIKGVKYRLEVAHWKDDEFGYETIEWLDEECPYTIITFDSYEESLSEGLRKAIEILKEK